VIFPSRSHQLGAQGRRTADGVPSFVPSRVFFDGESVSFLAARSFSLVSLFFPVILHDRPFPCRGRRPALSIFSYFFPFRFSFLWPRSPASSLSLLCRYTSHFPRAPPNAFQARPIFPNEARKSRALPSRFRLSKISFSFPLRALRCTVSGLSRSSSCCFLVLSVFFILCASVPPCIVFEAGSLGHQEENA